MTLVGTLRSNKGHIPPSFRSANGRQLNSSLFGFNKRKTLVSYVPKRDKVVIMLSSFHHSINLNPSNSFKPEIIDFYNRNKAGVDGSDQRIGSFSVKRSTRRWPYRVFQNLIDISCVNGHILLNELPGVKLNAYDFRTKLAYLLCKDQVESRNISNLPLEIRNNIAKFNEKIKSIQNLDPNSTSSSNINSMSNLSQNSQNSQNDQNDQNFQNILNANLNVKKRLRCLECTKDNKRSDTTIVCTICGLPYCKIHTKPICNNCL